MTAYQRRCTKCREVKPLASFSGQQYQCRPCHAAYNLARYHADPNRLAKQNAQQTRVRKRNMAFISEVKAAGCTDCGQTYPAPAMEFDHVRGDKATEVANLVGGCASLKRIKEEVAKCDLVCANCHRIRHYEARQEAA